MRAAVLSPQHAVLPGGAVLHYTDEGAGEPLLFVHGWTCDSTDFLWQIAHFRSRYRVIAVDLRGHGRSAALPDGYEPRIFARDLVELLDHLGVRRCVAVGHSLGGLLVSILAVEHPERVRAVVCVEPAYGVDEAGMAACRAIVAQMRTPDWPHLLADAFATWECASTPVYFRELHVRRMLAMDRRVVTDTFRHLFDGVDPLSCRAQSEAYLTHRACPVLGIHALDGESSVEWEKQHARHTASRFHYVPFGHWPQQDAPDLINDVIEHWLATLPPHA